MRLETRRPLIAVVGCAQFSLQEQPFDRITFQLSARSSTLRTKEREMLPAVAYFHAISQGNIISVLKKIIFWLSCFKSLHIHLPILPQSARHKLPYRLYKIE